MDKNNLGPYSQRNLLQMGDGHGKGYHIIKQEGTYAKSKDEKWKEFVLKDTGNGKQIPPTNSMNKQQAVKNKDLWKEKVLNSRTAFDKPIAPTHQIKQVEKAKSVMIKSK